MRKKRKVLLPKIAIKKMMDEAEEIAKRGFASAADIFEGWMGLIDRYRDYFYCESWPEKFDYERVTTFTQEDIDFIDENDEEYVDRVSAVLLKKSISLEGFNVNGEFAWAEQAFFKQFVNPELELVYNHFKELAKSDISAEDILNKLLETHDTYFVHRSLVEFVGDASSDDLLDLRVSEVLELLHAKGSTLMDEEESTCSYQREKLKKKAKEP